MDQEVSRGVKI